MTSAFFIGVAVGAAIVIAMIAVILPRPSKREVDRAVLKLFRRD